MMVHVFADLYTEIGIVLNSVFAEDIYLTTELRVPGFHIFPSDKKLGLLHMNPGAAGNHGFHKIKTLLRFNIDGDRIQDLEVIEIPRKL